MLTNRLRTAVIATAAAASLGLAVSPTMAAATVGRHAASVRTYDTDLLSHSNQARSADHRVGYAMNPKLWRIAHRWAQHMAATGVLAHNPDMVKQVGKACPSWSAVGENVGVVYGDSVTKLFQAYMHSPPHRANILDKRYSAVGIATVQVTRNGIAEQWDVMDFGNHC